MIKEAMPLSDVSGITVSSPAAGVFTPTVLCAHDKVEVPSKEGENFGGQRQVGLVVRLSLGCCRLRPHLHP